MARIAGVDLPKEKRIEIALTYLFGIGPSRSRLILENTGNHCRWTGHAINTKRSKSTPCLVARVATVPPWLCAKKSGASRPWSSIHCFSRSASALLAAGE